MIKFIYTVHDKKSGYDSLMLCENDDIAVRNFSIGVNSPGTLLHDFASDFELAKVAHFDTGNGEIIPVDPVVIVDAETLIKVE